MTVYSTTTFVPNVKFDLSKLQTKKRLSIGEGSSSPSIVKPMTTSNPKDKGKDVLVGPSTKENKKLQQLEMERLRQLNNIMRETNDLLGHNKGDPNKV